MKQFPKLEHVTVGPIQTNCYLLESQNGVIVVDPGAEPERIIDALHGRQIACLLITHAHFDHVGAVDTLVETYNCPWIIGEHDAPRLDRIALDAQSFGLQTSLNSKPSKTVGDSEIVQIGEYEFAVMECPGHTPGSVTYFNKEFSIAFTGDTLFATSCGRTDLPGGDMKAMRASLQKLASLPDDCLILCGHGPAAPMEWCRTHNPYLPSVV